MSGEKFSLYNRRLLVVLLIVGLPVTQQPDEAFSQQQPGYNTAFITDGQLTDANVMSEQEIKNFLVGHNSYFRVPVTDVDARVFDLAQVIFAVSQQYQINPQVILTTLQKESSGVTIVDRPSDATLSLLMGCRTPTTARAQIECAAERFRSYHDAQLSGGMTAGRWRVGVTKQTQDGIMVTPATMAVAGQFTYTPYAGSGWGGSDGGVYLFCQLWHSFGFGAVGCEGQVIPSTPIPTATPSPASCTVALDPGHGGPDPGAQRNGVNEKDIVWDVANRTLALLAQQGYQVVLTRAENASPSFSARWQAAYQADAAFLVSIHANAVTDVNAHGVEAWYQGANLNPHAAASQQLAQLLTDAVSNRLGLTNRGTKVGKALYSNRMPSALVELAFISNETERNLMVNSPDPFAVAVADAIISFAAGRCHIASPPPDSAATSTVLVFDTSGSMEGAKLSAAKQAGRNVLDIIAAEKQAGAAVSQVGLVDFYSFAQIDVPLVTDIPQVRAALDNLLAGGDTALPDGLDLAIDVLDADTHAAAKRIIILLSDGMANVGLGGVELDYAQVRQQVLDLAAEAAAKNYCIYTVGFGAGDEIDEELLRETARLSGCGEYYNAQNVTDLANVYVTLRHTSTGVIQLQQSGVIAQGEEINVGQLTVPPGQSLLLYTLNWPGSMLTPTLFDPLGRLVDVDYPGASLTTESSIATMIVNDPAAGDWQIGASGVDVPQGTTTYNAVVSTRAATVVPPSSDNNVIFWMMLLGLTAFAGIMWMRRQQASGWYLHVASPGQSPYQVKVDKQGVWVGRGSACQVRLQEPDVSRRHCWIGPYGDGAHLLVRDENSSLGVKRNGQQIRQGRFRETDVVEVGKTKLRVSRRGA